MENFRTKLVYTAVIYFLFLQLALRYGICGPSLADLRDNLRNGAERVTTDDVAKSISVMCVGICIGAISSGYLCKIISQELGTFFLVLATAGFVASITYFKQYGLFLAFNLLVGITSGAAISLCESWILDIWGTSCGPYMQALQFFRGLGYIAAPVLTDPFLSKREIINVNIQENELTSLNATKTSNGTRVYERVYASRIQTPYILNASMLTVGAICLLCLYIAKVICKRKQSAGLPKGISQEKILSSSTNSICNSKISIAIEGKSTKTILARSKYFGVAIITLSSLSYLFFYEEVIVIFLPTFATNLAVNISTKEASLLTAAFSLANVLGKAVGVLLALKISHIVILYMNLSLMIGSLVLIIACGNSSVTMLWIGICLHGLGLSSIIASLYTLMASAISMSPSICGLLNMMGTLGSVFLPLIIGKHLDQFPMALMFACLVCATICLLLSILMHVLLINKHTLIGIPVSEKNECSISKVDKF